MIKIQSLKPGDVLYDVHSERAGNTTMRREGVWECYVRAVDPNGQWVEISRNGNPARRFAAVPRGYKRAPKIGTGRGSGLSRDGSNAPCKVTLDGDKA